MLNALLILVLAGTPADAPSKNLAQTAVEAGQFKTLVTAVERAGLLKALSGREPLTVFAPTDEAFAKLPKGTVASLLEPANRDKLMAILTLHVVPGRVTAIDALRAGTAKSLGGLPLSIRLVDGRVRVGDANVVKTDIRATNGVIHVIDRVLLPPAKVEPVKATLELAIDRGVPLFNAGQAKACADIYEVAVRAIVALGADQLAERDRRTLTAALGKLPDDDEGRAWVLRRAMDAVLVRAEKKKESVSTFKPRMEAPLPVGFPKPGPVGSVVVKRYPEYRAARAEGRNSFWTLFTHIKKNKIEMTAPVEMTMSDDMATQDMAFLYVDPKLGKRGKDGRVDVVDLGKTTVLSFGIRGPMAADKVAAAKRAIEKELSARGWQKKASWRLLGYNSPMVPPAQRFWELQLPVTDRAEN